MRNRSRRIAGRVRHRRGDWIVPGVNFDRAVAFYDATRALPDGVADRVGVAILERVGAGPATRFLEVGIGTGRITLPLVRAGYLCHGVDLSAAMLGALRAKLAAEPGRAGRLRLARADAMALPFQTGVFDVVLVIHLLHLVDDPRQALHEIRRVLSPGGRVLISASQYAARGDGGGRDHTGWRAVTRRWNEILVDLGVDRSQRPRGRWVPEEAITATLQAMGASVERVVLAEYRERRTPREIAAAHRDRIYSSDWETPDDVHADAVRRLTDWLDTAHAPPDTPFSEDASFEALIGTL